MLARLDAKCKANRKPHLAEDSANFMLISFLIYPFFPLGYNELKTSDPVVEVELSLSSITLVILNLHLCYTLLGGLTQVCFELRDHQRLSTCTGMHFKVISTFHELQSSDKQAQTAKLDVSPLPPLKHPKIRPQCHRPLRSLSNSLSTITSNIHTR